MRVTTSIALRCLLLLSASTHAVIAISKSGAEAQRALAHGSNQTGDVEGVSSSSVKESNNSVGKGLEVGMFIVTLPKRQEYVQTFVAEHKLENAVIVPAVDKLGLNVTELLQSGKVLNNSESRFDWKDAVLGEIACALAHRIALQTFLSNDKYTHGLVMEDDVMINDSTFAKMKTSTTEGKLGDVVAAIAATSESSLWEHINLGRCNAACSKDMKRGVLPSGVNLVQGNDQASCTTAYIVTRKGAQQLLDFPVDRPVDYVPISMETSFDLRPRLFQQNHAFDVGSMHKKDSVYPECQNGDNSPL